METRPLGEGGRAVCSVVVRVGLGGLWLVMCMHAEELRSRIRKLDAAVQPSFAPLSASNLNFMMCHELGEIVGMIEEDGSLYSTSDNVLENQHKGLKDGYRKAAGEPSRCWGWGKRYEPLAVVQVPGWINS